MNIFKNSLKKGLVTIDSACFKALSAETTDNAGIELRSLIRKKFGRSFHIREVDTGSCGGCESEIISATNPIYDLQRFGVDFVASPGTPTPCLLRARYRKTWNSRSKERLTRCPAQK